MNRLAFPCLLLIFFLAASTLSALTRNAGLGPLEVRNHYPVTHAYLWMYPESTATLPDGASPSYSFSMANTFVNTQGSTQITKTEYDAESLPVTLKVKPLAKLCQIWACTWM